MTAVCAYYIGQMNVMMMMIMMIKQTDGRPDSASTISISTGHAGNRYVIVSSCDKNALYNSRRHEIDEIKLLYWTLLATQDRPFRKPTSRLHPMLPSCKSREDHSGCPENSYNSKTIRDRSNVTITNGNRKSVSAFQKTNLSAGYDVAVV